MSTSIFPEVLESKRLTFERLSRQTVDVHNLYEVLGSNPHAGKIFEFMGSNPHRTIKDTFDLVRRADEQFNDGEGARYIVRPKPTEEYGGEIAGLAGMYPKWECQSTNLSFLLDTRFWGNGYSAERAGLFLEVAFNVLDLELVAVEYIDGNEKSKRAIEKYIDQFNGQYDGLLRNWSSFEGGVYDVHRYTVSRDQYRAAINKSEN